MFCNVDKDCIIPNLRHRLISGATDAHEQGLDVQPAGNYYLKPKSGFSEWKILKWV